MNNWFTVKVKYTKQLDNGTFKRVSEPYLLAAMTFTDAEARIYEELGSIIRGEFNVVGITRTEIHDIFAYDDADIWYKVKITYDSEAADDEKAKKVAQNFLVSAHSVKDAFDRMSSFNTKRLMELASFILNHINSNICPSSMRTRQLRPKGPSSPPRPIRCQTPKARRTCVQCETLLNDVDDTYLCPNCIHFRK